MRATKVMFWTAQLVGVAATIWLLWGSKIPLGVPGEWVWDRIQVNAAEWKAALDALQATCTRVRDAVDIVSEVAPDLMRLSERCGALLDQIVRFAAPAKSLFEKRPAIAAWLKQCQSRPAFQRMWAARDAEPA